jgi:hypothetical protein
MSVGQMFFDQKDVEIGQSLLTWNSRVQYPNPQILEIGKNALAYFATASVTKKKNALRRRRRQTTLQPTTVEMEQMTTNTISPVDSKY